MIITNTVEPIKDKKQIDMMKNYLKLMNYRDYLLFLIGINTGMKVCDLLRLKFSDVLNYNSIKETVISKDKVYPINKSVSIAINKYIEMDLGEHLFERYIFERSKGSEPIGRSHAYRIINQAAEMVGINQKIGLHTLRKTYGYHYYKKYKDISKLQTLFNHSAPSVTLKYIGIELKVIKPNSTDFEL